MPRVWMSSHCCSAPSSMDAPSSGASCLLHVWRRLLVRACSMRGTLWPLACGEEPVLQPRRAHTVMCRPEELLRGLIDSSWGHIVGGLAGGRGSTEHGSARRSLVAADSGPRSGAVGNHGGLHAFEVRN
ncbi:hypothetical protein EJB05_12725 [Eragrostis curvula]|uniref:Uncharacterized protein n=1 Tax=Eragrostis curvula TaxID=38414 RepID=A0A5J9VSC3_9POAL|nr:hypothetical protein EJB05_12725 [Eragrostis curvula]